MLRFGKITEVNPTNCYARVTFTDDDTVSAELQILVRAAVSDKDSFTFEINEQVACLMDENSEQGVILGAVFNNKTLPPEGGGPGIFRMRFSDDSVIEYNRQSHEYKIDVQGAINIKATGETKVEAASVSVLAEIVDVEATSVQVTAETITIEGETTITGNLTVSGTVTASTAISSPSISGPGVTMSVGNMTADGEISGMAVKAGAIDLATHAHGGVSTGGGTTGPPV